jgi:cytochrome P450 family 138
MTATSIPVAHLPPGPRWPSPVQAAALLASRMKTMEAFEKRFGTAFTVKLPVFGPTVVISDPALAKQLFQTSSDVVAGVEPNLSIVLGPGSTFGLQGDLHRRRRKILVPALHGKRMRAYEGIVEEETLRETATWPQGQEFAVLPSTTRITLGVILRAVFGAEGAELDALREIVPRGLRLGAKVVLPRWLHVDLGRWSPWGRFLAMRREFDSIVGSLIARAAADPHLDQRADVLSLMLQARYDDGTAMSHSDITDELATLVGAGFETTTNSLAWAVERLRRHPRVLSRLVEEVDAGGSDLLQATVHEVLRSRPVIDGAVRQVIAPSLTLGEWVIPRGYTVQVNIALMHQNDAIFPDAGTFDPDRFLGVKPDTYSWVPFGGGSRRCLGAAFANMEMNVALRTMLREFRLVPTDAPGEISQPRGLAFIPRDGGRVVVYRRSRNSAQGDDAGPRSEAAHASGTARPHHR